MFRFDLQLFGGRGQTLRKKANTGPHIGATPDLKQFNRSAPSRGIDESLAMANPNYKTGNPLWSENCQRCVYAYELLRRGYDVEAKPYLGKGDHLASLPGIMSIVKNPGHIDDLYVKGDKRIEIKSEVERRMQAWGDGARAIITVSWKGYKRKGHAFMVENVGGKIIYVDPQNNMRNASSYFKNIKPFTTVLGHKLETTMLLRVDNATFTPVINDAVQNRKP